MAVAVHNPTDTVAHLSADTAGALAVIVHDVRSPLADIILAAEHLAGGHTGAVSDEQKSLLQLIARNAQRALALTSDLNTACECRSDSAAAPALALHRETQDLAALTAECVANARIRAEAHGVTLVLAGDLEAYAWYDPIRIEQVLDNLVSNAVKFTPPGGRIVVSVDARRSDVVSLSVSDTGIGIAKDEQQLVRRRSYRATSATRWGIPGSGLGLAIVEAIVRAHGGHLTIESEEGTGTTVHVELPRAPWDESWPEELETITRTGNGQGGYHRSLAAAPAGCVPASRLLRALPVALE